jgi:hypothetical protein
VFVFFGEGGGLANSYFQSKKGEKNGPSSPDFKNIKRISPDFYNGFQQVAKIEKYS